MKKSLSGGRTLATVIFGMCAVILFTVAIIISGIRMMISKEGIAKAVSNSDTINIEVTEDITELVYENLPKETVNKFLTPTWIISFTAMGLLSIGLIYLLSKKRLAYTITATGVISLVYATLTYMVSNNLMNMKIEDNEELGRVFMQILSGRMRLGATIGVILGIAEIVCTKLYLSHKSKQEEDVLVLENAFEDDIKN